MRSSSALRAKQPRLQQLAPRAQAIRANTDLVGCAFGGAFAQYGDQPSVELPARLDPLEVNHPGGERRRTELACAHEARRKPGSNWARVGRIGDHAHLRARRALADGRRIGGDILVARLHGLAVTTATLSTKRGVTSNMGAPSSRRLTSGKGNLDVSTLVLRRTGHFISDQPDILEHTATRSIGLLPNCWVCPNLFWFINE